MILCFRNNDHNEDNSSSYWGLVNSLRPNCSRKYGSSFITFSDILNGCYNYVGVKGKDTLTVLVSVSLLQGGDTFYLERGWRQQDNSLENLTSVFRRHVIMSAYVSQYYEIFNFTSARTYSLKRRVFQIKYEVANSDRLFGCPVGIIQPWQSDQSVLCKWVTSLLVLYRLASNYDRLLGIRY